MIEPLKMKARLHQFESVKETSFRSIKYLYISKINGMRYCKRKGGMFRRYQYREEVLLA